VVFGQKEMETRKDKVWQAVGETLRRWRSGKAYQEVQEQSKLRL